MNVLETLTSNTVDYRPQVDGKLYSAEDIARETGVSKNRVGRVSNANNLKTDEYGMYVLDKSQSSEKQIEVFRYNERGKETLVNLIEIGVTNGSWSRGVGK
ncbi:hypothetical protein D3C78_1706230 [compost metagenome]